MDRKTKPEDISAWEAGIVYPDGRGAVVLTPLDGVPYVEAEAIGRTYQETAHAEGGHIEVHSLRGYPTAGNIATLLGTAEANLERRTGRKFTLTLFGGVLRSRRDDGFHAAVQIPPTPPQTFRRNEGELVGSDAVTPPAERDRLSFGFRVEDAVDAIVRGHEQGAAS